MTVIRTRGFKKIKSVADLVAAVLAVLAIPLAPLLGRARPIDVEPEPLRPKEASVRVIEEPGDVRIDLRGGSKEQQSAESAVAENIKEISRKMLSVLGEEKKKKESMEDDKTRRWKEIEKAYHHRPWPPREKGYND